MLEIASIPKTSSAMIREATITTTVVLCKSDQVGQVTLLINSL